MAKETVARTEIGGFQNCQAVIEGNRLTMTIDLTKVARPKGRIIKDKKGGEKAAPTALLASSCGYRWVDTPLGRLGVSMNVNLDAAE